MPPRINSEKEAENALREYFKRKGHKNVTLSANYGLSNFGRYYSIDSVIPKGRYIVYITGIIQKD